MSGEATSRCIEGDRLPEVGLCVAFGRWGMGRHWGPQWTSFWSSARWTFESGTDIERAPGGSASCSDVDELVTVTADAIPRAHGR